MVRKRGALRKGHGRCTPQTSSGVRSKLSPDYSILFYSAVLAPLAILAISGQ